MAMIFATVLLAQTTGNSTWCWAPDLHTARTCTYTRQQCEAIVRLRRTGIGRASAGIVRSRGNRPSAD